MAVDRVASVVFDRLRRRAPEPPGFDPNRVPDQPRETIVETSDGRYTCHAVDSVDGKLTAAYGRRHDGGDSRVFLLRDDAVEASIPATRPTAAAVAADGTVVVVERGGSDTTVHRVRGFRDDVETLDRSVVATVTGVAVGNDGGLAAVATRRPDGAVRAYDVDTGEPAWVVDPPRAVPRLLGFHSDGDRELLYVSRERREEPYVAVDASGEIVWGNERYRATRPLSERVRGWLDRT